MGTLTHADLKTEVMDHLANPSDLTAAKVTRHLNLAQEQIARVRDFEEMKRVGSYTLAITGTPATDKLLAVGMTVREIYSLRVVDGTNSRRLTRIGQRKWDRLVPEPDQFATGLPSDYMLWNNVIEFWRVPDDNYPLHLRWSIWPTVLSTDGQQSDLDEKDDILIFFAVSTLFNSRGNTTEGAKFFNFGAQRLRDAVREDETKPDLLIRAEERVPIAEPWKDPFVRNA